MDAVERLRGAAEEARMTWWLAEWTPSDPSVISRPTPSEAQHIAAWDPTVALAALDVIEAARRYAQSPAHDEPLIVAWRSLGDATRNLREALAAFEKAAGQ